MNILLNLYLKSLQHNEKLLLNEMTPLSAEMIEHLSSYMAYSGRTYENHLATMEYWKTVDRKREKRVQTGGYTYNGSFKEGDSL